jgi:hypothetical protein
MGRFRGFGARTAELRKNTNYRARQGPKPKADPHEGRTCRSCQERPAEAGGVCSQCRSQGRVDSADEQRRRAERRAWLEAQRTDKVVQRIEVPKRKRTIVVAGVEYEVLWDGKVDAHQSE